MPATPHTRIEKLIATLERRVKLLLDNNAIEEMSAYERESAAARYGMLILRLLELQSQTDTGNNEPSGNALIAQLIGLKIEEAKQ